MRRVSVTAILALVVPLALLAGWAWLVGGGRVDGLATAERRAAADTFSRFVRELEAGLVRAAPALGFTLTLDAAGRPREPFVAAPAFDDVVARVDRVDRPLVAATAIDLARAGRPDEALPFFEQAVRAATESTADPELELWYARTLAFGGDAPGALARLDAVTAAVAGSREVVQIRGLPFALVVGLTAIELAAEPDERVRRLAAFERGLHDGTVPVPADGVEAVFARLDRLRGEAEDPPAAARARTLAAAAAWRTWPDEALDSGVHVIEGGVGAVVVDRDSVRAWILSNADVRAIARDSGGVVRATDSMWAVEVEGGAAVSAGRAADALVSRTVPVLDAVVHVVPTEPLGSGRLRSIGRWLLTLAAITFAFGNLVLVWLARREYRLSQLKSEFVDVVSHELRTPLAALSLKAEMLARGDVPDARRQHYLDGVWSDVRRLDEQVQRVLDFARLAKGRQPVALRPVAARAVAARGVRAARDAMRLAGRRLAVVVPRELPDLVADPDVLARALRNLIDNAARHAPAGTCVELGAAVSGHGVGGGAAEVVFAVRDRGPGVPASQRRAVFEPFRGLEGAGRARGSGLGLAIVAAAARAHGGRADVVARDGGGAEFRLFVPLAAAGAEREEQA